jgi:3-oxoacyl-[acyl-carrier-protein] synthase II
MKLYIRSSACISPQKTFGSEGFLTEVTEYNESRLRTIEPDYKKYIDPMLIRRMSHVIKMGVATAKECLDKGNIEVPGAIVTGSAYGCMSDTISFLTRIIEQEETMLSPTSFIQSTHNTVAAQIALMLQCHEYNNTFVHKGISFESALLDAMMLLNEKEADNILVGGLDEMTDTSFTILTRLGLYKQYPGSNLSLLSTKSRGTIGGEGAAFFLLTDKPWQGNLAELMAIKTYYKPDKETTNIEENITSFLESNALKINDIDLVITGRNGDLKNDKVYKQLSEGLFKNNALADYKHLCGEYPTSSAFALWMGANIIKNGVVPEIVRAGNTKISAPKKVLIYNHYQHKYHSLILLSSI